MRRDLPSYEELLKIFSAEKLKPIRTIAIAISLGMLFFFVMIMVLYYTQYGSGPSKNNSELLSTLNGYFIVGVFMLSILGIAEEKIFTHLVKARKITSTDISNSESRLVLNLIKIFTLMRLTRIESGLLLMVFWLLTNAQKDNFDSNLHYWFLIPIVIVLYYVAETFPTGKRVAKVIQKKIYPLLED